MLDRRQFLATAAGSLAAACARKPPAEIASAAAAVRSPGASLTELLDRLTHDYLSKHPTLFTALGMDKGQYAWAKEKLEDMDLQRREQEKQENADYLRRLRAFDRRPLAGTDLANYDTVEFYLETNARLDPFKYGEGMQPYVVTQRDGAYQSVPDFLDNQHTIENKADVDAYLARLRAFAVVLDQETERVRYDAGLGVIPPDFIIDRGVQQMRALRAIAPAQSTLSTSVAKRAKEKGIAGDFGAEATRIVAKEIYPALDRQIAAIQQLRPKAVPDAGVGRLPDGAAFYQVTLRQFTTTDLSADEIHRLGLTQVAELSSEMDAILRKQGLKDGPIAERVQALFKDPKHLFPNTDAGRQQILEYCNGLITALQPRLPEAFGRMPKTPVEVRRIPPYTEAGAAGGYYQRPTLDGSRPGAFYINLRDTAELPRWTLPTLTYHEAAPGHHFQLALVTELPDLPLIRKMMFFSANTEGWALYAEQLCDEMGLYKDDPLGRLGRLQATIFRAARCVVDTGLHAKGWTRQQAIDYMVGTTGDSRAAMTTEVERYCVFPGQATSYKVGHTLWVKLREDARAKLGSKFDLRAFHDVGLTAAPMPLAVLERIVNAWVAGQS